jgi:hypothetical protein
LPLFTSLLEEVFSETQGSGDIEKSRGPSRLRSFHAFARLHLGRNVTEEESHADLFCPEATGRSRIGRRGTLGVSMKQAIGALVLVVLVLIIVLRLLGVL